ncbi:outer membrane beta-barrel protein [Halomonas sp. KAO]|uniref:outer membrane beta-barrel protein n=1 Tax=unclassified Halomonas TaxID=2609666 RepID=UPI00189F6BFA|nr:MULTISPECIES: outer membrane beta-barrel protein [unclassified Halomonas]MBF7052204.1 outer membrane beta-barrel protein [Halomonas sp. KAO]MDT0501665.1 outer membrane beta-barrel protein [Halomonas sp. PAR7]MDT0512073.1 outer membrane beta-barrel protein [Halomonas sp. LES1]MDT0590790.1 outer membrane beta-barrel protein [Halomonas sp. PAR8]
MKRLIATAALATLVASPAFAQSYQYDSNEGPYIGAGLGHSETDFDISGYYRDRGYPNTNTDDSDTGYKLFVGYQFNPNFAIEAGYVDFGEFTANENGGSAKAKLSVDGFSAALVGKLPIQNGFSIFGKLGMIAWDADLNESDNTGSSSYGRDGSDPLFGIGAEYEVERILMRAEFERYDISEDGEDFEIDLISASIGYRF